MMPLYNQTHDYILLYVPKAACSLLRKIYVYLHEDEFTVEQKEILNTKSHHSIGSIHNGNKLPLDKIYSTKKLIVCRSPYTRTLSAYYDKFINILHRKNLKTFTFYNLLQFYSHVQCLDKLRHTVNSIKNSNAIGVTLKEIYEINGIDASDHIYNDSFLAYLQFISTCIQNNIICYDEHHKPQTSINKNNLCKLNLFKNTEVFHLEDNINENVFKLLKPYVSQKLLRSKQSGIKDILNDKNINSTPPKKHIDSLDCSTFNSHQLNEIYSKSGFLPDIENMLYNPCVNNLIKDIYCDDFLHLKYNFID